MEKHHLAELHLLPISPPPPEKSTGDSHHAPPLDLQLSISVGPHKSPSAGAASTTARRLELLRWQAEEQKRLAAKEMAYAERVREVTRREMEMAKSELARARILWDRTTEELARADMIKLNSVIRVTNYPLQQQEVGMASSSSSSSTSNYTCMEIICHCCRRRFRP